MKKKEMKSFVWWIQVKKNEKHCHIICYESRFWLKIEKEYDAEKCECYDVLKMFKKC